MINNLDINTHEKIYNGIDALKYCIRCGIEAGKYVTKNITCNKK